MNFRLTPLLLTLDTDHELNRILCNLADLRENNGYTNEDEHVLSATEL